MLGDNNSIPSLAICGLFVVSFIPLHISCRQYNAGPNSNLFDGDVRVVGQLMLPLLMSVECVVRTRDVVIKM